MKLEANGLSVSRTTVAPLSMGFASLRIVREGTRPFTGVVGTAVMGVRSVEVGG